VRVDFTNYGNPSYTAFWSVKFRVAVPVIADWIRPSSCLGVNGEGCPKAIDGNTATSYAPTVKSGSIEFDLGSSRLIDGIELWKHLDAEGNGIKSVTIFTSLDKKSFSEQKKLTSAYAPKNNFERFPLDTAVSARYVRVDFTNYGRHYTSFWSVKFHIVTQGWVNLPFNTECDAGSGEVYLSQSSSKVSDLEACKKSCEDAAKCKSMTFYSGNWCSHFSTACTKTKTSDKAISMGRGD